MTKPKVTDWFPASVKPVRHGWYQVRYVEEGEYVRRRFFDGFEWRFRRNGDVSEFGFQGDTWRGLTAKAR